MRARLAVLGVVVLATIWAPLAAIADTLMLKISPWQEDWLDLNFQNSDRWRREKMQREQAIRDRRHRSYLTQHIPAPYAGMISPLEPRMRDVSEGGRLYSAWCAGCHGADGFGNGDAGRALDPSPALLAFMVRMPQAVDEYLMWSIAEGGLPFGSDMPVFKDRLSRDEIWQIISYMRAGFPSGSVK